MIVILVIHESRNKNRKASPFGRVVIATPQKRDKIDIPEKKSCDKKCCQECDLPCQTIDQFLFRNYETIL